MQAYEEQPAGQATFEMANLREKTTGLPFVVFISQRGGARHDVRVKASRSAKALPSQMSSYALRPSFALMEGPGLTPAEERMLQKWAALNEDVIVRYWDGDIGYTEDAVEMLKPV